MQILIGWLALFAVRHIWKSICCIDRMQMFVPVWTDAFEPNFQIKMFITPDVCTEHLSLWQMQALNLGKWNFVPSFTLLILYPGSESSHTPSDFWAKCCCPFIIFTVLIREFFLFFIFFLHMENEAPYLACRKIY